MVDTAVAQVKELQRQSSSFERISRRGHQPLDTWEHAAQFRMEDWQPIEREVPAYLANFGYKATSAQNWEERPSKERLDSPRLEIDLKEHFEKGGYTWYMLECSVAIPDLHGDSPENRLELAWPAPRRLAHLRVDLHDRVKAILSDRYQDHFSEAHFAHYWAPSGTTARLSAWLTTLVDLINSGRASPKVAALLYQFLEAPKAYADEDPELAAISALDMSKPELEQMR